MIRYVVKRLLWMIPVMLGIAILIFTIMYICPGDPAQSILGPSATAVELAAKREEMGLNDPYLVRLGRYLYDTFIRFDLGTSYKYGTSVLLGLLERMRYTLVVALLCMALQVFVGTPLGIMAATHHNGIADRICMFFALVGVSIPAFWLALMLVLIFAVNLGWLPVQGVDGGFACYILPCIANSFAGIASQARHTRSSMLEVIRSDYVVTAKSKGLSEKAILFRHALPNALIPIITVVGNGMGMMLGGTVIIENVFAIPGVGRYMTDAITARDYPVEYRAIQDYNNLRRSLGRCEDQLTAVGRELFSGMFEKYPKVKLVHSMLGGGFFTYQEMLMPHGPAGNDGRFTATPETMRKHLAENVFFEMSHAQPWGRVLLETAVKILGADHIVYGSSSPVKAVWRTEGPAFVRELEITEEEKNLILWGNAQRLYHL